MDQNTKDSIAMMERMIESLDNQFVEQLKTISKGDQEVEDECKRMLKTCMDRQMVAFQLEDIMEKVKEDEALALNKVSGLISLSKPGPKLVN